MDRGPGPTRQAEWTGRSRPPGSTEKASLDTATESAAFRCDGHCAGKTKTASVVKRTREPRAVPFLEVPFEGMVEPQ